MRRVFIFACALLLAAPLHLKAGNWAREELEKSRRELADVRDSIRAEKERLSKDLKDAFSDLEKANRNCEAQLQKASDITSLSQSSKFYDSMCDEMYADLRALASYFSISSGMAHQHISLSELRGESEKTIGAAAEAIFNPLKLRDYEAVDPKSGAPLPGKSFRIGAFSFFVGDGEAGFLSPKGEVYGKNYGPKIRAFADSKTDLIPVDLSGGSLLELEKSRRSFAEEVKLGGVWMYPILFFGALSAVVLIFKIARFALIRRAPADVVARITSALSRGDEAEALKIARSAGWPYSNLLSELIMSRRLDSSMLEEVSYEYMLTSGEKIFSGLSVLSVSAAVSPLFGLLGTVTGIIKTFGDLSFQGAAQAQFISAGISEALITTEYGLIVAIPAFVAHALLSRRAKAVMSDMEKLASAFLSGVSRKNNG